MFFEICHCYYDRYCIESIDCLGNTVILTILIGRGFFNFVSEKGETRIYLNGMVIELIGRKWLNIVKNKGIADSVWLLR